MIYFDNSATSYPKPNRLLNKVKSIYEDCSFNVGRSGYLPSMKTAQKVFAVREKLADMFNLYSENIIFTKNCTEALNTAIKGILEKGDHVIISSLEHNSVSRILYQLFKENFIEYDIADYSRCEDELISNFKKRMKTNTKAIVCTYASNVFGVTFPIRKIGKLCKDNGIKFILDAAQGAGIAEIDAVKDNIDVICAPGHKCLYGPMGTGFLGINEGVKLKSFEQGGTGSESLNLFQPDYYPDKLESGTLNCPGIILLGYGIDFVNKEKIENIYSHELNLCRFLYEELKEFPNIKLYTDYPEKNKTMPILSFNVDGISSEAAASVLADNGICVRAGYHCSFLAHKHFSTLENGTVRISPGYFNDENDCEKLLRVVKKL